MSEWRVDRCVQNADTSVVKKKLEWNSMAGEEEWLEKHRDMEGEGKGDGHRHGRKPRIPEPCSLNSLETHLVRKWRDIGHLRALSPWSNGWDGCMHVCICVLCLYVRIYSCMDVCIYTPMYPCMYLCVHVLYMHACLYICTCMYMYVRMYDICMYSTMYIHMYSRMYACIYVSRLCVYSCDNNIAMFE